MILSRERCRQFNYYRNPGRSATPHDRRARSPLLQARAPDRGEHGGGDRRGDILEDAYLAALNHDSEIYLIHKIGGG
jgi:hypothetical protein